MRSVPGPDGHAELRRLVDGMRVVVLGLEDLLVDRLRAWVHWKSDEDGRWAARLVALYRSQMDWTYLRSKVAGDAAEQAALERLEGGAP